MDYKTYREIGEERRKSAISDAIDTFILNKVSRESRILIKTDLTGELNSPETGSTVNVELIDLIVSELNQKISPKRIYIGESEKTLSLKEVFERQGYAELETKYSNVHLVNLSRGRIVKTNLQNPRILRNVSIPEIALTCDCIINVSTFKRHLFERVSGSLANLYEFISKPETRIRLRPFFKEAVFDLNSLLMPSLSIVDMDVVLEGSGPVHGEPRQLGILVVGDDPLLADLVAIKLIGENYKKVPHVKYVLNRMKDKTSYLRRIETVSKFAELDFVKRKDYLVVRLSISLNRFSIKIENLGFLVFLTAQAFISIGGKNLIKGRWVPLKDYYLIAKKVLNTVEDCTDSLAWKIVINKHVVEESIS
jgi:uncharacterized protein (DUF362 family)